MDGDKSLVKLAENGPVSSWFFFSFLFSFYGPSQLDEKLIE